ncbi:L-fucose:H+ symporter permease [Adhaeribacter rhizoryzae]|uniref:L-fucose:H+ symporter permease n=1 Tax=Adhaeribacter rhizoryzae TaxID=2607907 RepID=A0A5M6DMX1_9BACT|nr:L-fucose:H+ symporter permease [Adhaeribacter rhizoryzae]KAA5546755.1 L-fucose:H+ symporter permease [Adhaeribacter rhizoryzae]
MLKNNNRFAILLITSLFFLWGFVLNLNPILIPHLKKACQLTDAQSAFIDSASYLAYFLLAIPAGLFIKRFGYKGGIIFGLLLFAIGSFLFYPAAETRTYGFFLLALFIIASGLTFLETAANPYITVLGDPEGATQRLNFAQSFNGLAATLAPFLGGLFILSGQNLSAETEAAMSPQALDAYLQQEAASVKIPFLIIGFIVLMVVVLLWRTRLPEIEEEKDGATESGGSILKEKNLMLGVMAQFFYVGGQVCVSSFFIRFAGRVAGIEEKTAALFLSGALLAFMVGRFFGTFLMKYIPPARLLALYSIINVFLLILAVILPGMFSVYALVGVEFFMSIMFPTIFSLSIRGLGAKTKLGSSLVIMAIVGGAIFPVIMGAVSDSTNIQIAYLVPVVCFVAIFYFALQNFAVKRIKMATAH